MTMLYVFACVCSCRTLATYNRYLKELLTKKNCYFFSLTYQTEGNAFWSHAVIAGCRQFGSFKKVTNVRLPLHRGFRFWYFDSMVLSRDYQWEHIRAAITKTMTANRHMTILKDMSIRRCFSLIITTPCSIAPFKLFVFWQQFGSKRMLL